MAGEIEKLIKEKQLKMSDVGYHTIRVLAEPKEGKIRALILKGETTAHIEYTCPSCGGSAYKQQPWVDVSKGSKYRFSTKCDKCGFEIKVPKLKGRPKDKKKE